MYNSKRLPLSCREYIDYTEDKTIIDSAFNREDDENEDTKISGEEEVNILRALLHLCKYFS